MNIEQAMQWKFCCTKIKQKKNTPEKKIHCWNQGRKKCREKKQRKCLYFISGFKLNALLFFFRIFASVSVCLPYILKIQRNRDKENKPTALDLWSSRLVFFSFSSLSRDNIVRAVPFCMLFLSFYSAYCNVVESDRK